MNIQNSTICLQIFKANTIYLRFAYKYSQLHTINWYFNVRHNFENKNMLNTTHFSRVIQQANKYILHGHLQAYFHTTFIKDQNEHSELSDLNLCNLQRAPSFC